MGNRNTRKGYGDSIYQDDSAQVSGSSSRYMSPLVGVDENGVPKRSMSRRAQRGITNFITNPRVLTTLGILGASAFAQTPLGKKVYNAGVNGLKIGGNALSRAYNYTSDKFHKLQNMFNSAPVNSTVPSNSTALEIPDNFTKHNG